MESYKCPECGNGEMKVLPPHARLVRFAGQSFIVNDAVVFSCSSCRKTNVTADELKRWEEISKRQKTTEISGGEGNESKKAD